MENLWESLLRDSSKSSKLSQGTVLFVCDKTCDSFKQDLLLLLSSNNNEINRNNVLQYHYMNIEESGNYVDLWSFDSSIWNGNDFDMFNEISSNEQVSLDSHLCLTYFIFYINI